MKKLLFVLAFVILLTLPLFASAEEETLEDESGDNTALVQDEEPFERILGYNQTLPQDYDSGKYGDELYYLSSFGGEGGRGDASISVKDCNATFTFYFDNAPYGRYETRLLSDEEYKRFVDSIQEMNADTLEDFPNPNVCDGIEYGYLHFTKDQKSEVYMDNPDYYQEQKNAVYQRIVDLFWNLKETGDFEVGYTIPGSQLLINRDDYIVQSVWKNGDDFRVCIEKNHKLEWHSFKNGVIGDRALEPEKITLETAWDDIPGTPVDYQDWGTFFTDEAFLYTEINKYPWQITWNGYCVRFMIYDDRGLYLTKKGEKPRLVASGWFLDPLVIPGTDYVICTEKDLDSGSYKLVKINLQTSEKVALPIAPELCGLECVAMFGDKFILMSGYGYYLYNLDTGETQPVKCDSGIDVKERFLQKAEGKNNYYTVKHGDQDCVLGVINIEDFSFTHIKTYEHMYIEPMKIWVDGDRAYAVINGDLVSLPLDDDLINVTNTLMWSILKEKYPDVPDDELKQIIEDNSYNWIEIINALENKEE